MPNILPQGVKEIVLTGVNLGDFGKGPPNLAQGEGLENFFELSKRTGKGRRHSALSDFFHRTESAY